ncbi:MAG: hypothetical protein ACRD3J_07185 [Thermoanaerobaculia bacterium]
MRRLIILLIVLAALFAGYRHYHNTSGPVNRYKAFAEEVLHRRYDAAAAMTDGMTVAELEKLGSQERIGAGPPMFQTIFPSRFTIDSSETGADGVVTINATQTVLFNPAGVESAVRPAMYATLKQVTKLRSVSGEWKVVSFENTFGAMDSTSRR